MEQALIFDIQSYSVHDGPGCRTLVFLSGCPLACTWCSNPEGQLKKQQLLFHDKKCSCQTPTCIAACPLHAITQSPEVDSARITINRHTCLDICTTFDCVHHCYASALTIAGTYMSSDDLIKILKRDQNFWGAEGGVTFGGGEPFVHQHFIAEILSECKKNYMHTAVETSGFVDVEFLQSVLPLIDWLFIDLKHMDSAIHRQYTGCDNTQNLAVITAMSPIGRQKWPGRLVVRIPVIPGFNDSDTVIEKAAQFISNQGIEEVNIIPFHRMAVSKYEKLGKRYAFQHCIAPSKEKMLHIKKLLTKYPIQCYIDFETPF